MNPDEFTVVSDSGERMQQHRDRLKDEEYGLHLVAVCSIDLGSNSFHMLVVREVAGSIRR